MHELSIARNVLDQVAGTVGPGDLGRIRSIRLRVGVMSGVVRDSLEFCFSAIKQGTPLEHAALEFEERPFVVRCNACGERTSNEFGIAVCELCGSPETVIESGTELDIVQLELVDQRTS